MKSFMNLARNKHRRAILNFFLLSGLLLASEFTLLAQSRVDPAPLRVGKQPETEAAPSVEMQMNSKVFVPTADCFKKMADETARYIQKARIPIRGGRGEYFSQNGAETFLLSSVEKLNLSAGKRSSKIVSVINYKAGNTNSIFYVIDAEAREGSIIYSIKKDSRVLQSLRVRSTGLYRISGPGVDPCPEMNKQNGEILASIQLEANQSCQTRRVCLGICQNRGASIAWALFEIKPNNLKWCFGSPQYYSSFDLVYTESVAQPAPGPLFDWTIWKALQNDSALFN